MGASPAMPLIHNNRIYAATSDEWMSLLCDEQSCTIDSIEPFSSNGELALRIIDSDVEIWAPSNTPNGGWGVFNETSLIRTETTFFDTYGTAAPGFGQGVVVLGNDAGILSVIYQIRTSHHQKILKSTLLGYYITCLFSCSLSSPALILLYTIGKSLPRLDLLFFSFWLSQSFQNYR